MARFKETDLYLLMGSSAGIGKAIAVELASQGASLIVASRSSERISATIEQCESLAPSRAQRFLSLTLDFCDPKSPDALEQSLKKQAQQEAKGFSLAGLLINGGGPHGDSVLQLSSRELEHAHDLLFKGPVLHVQKCLNYLRDGASLLAITSTTVKEPHPSLTLSGCYRNALTSYLKSLSDALATRQMRVNALAPGFVNTQRLGQLREHEAKARGLKPEEMNEVWAKRAPLCRIAHPKEIATTAAFLLSSESSFITGQTLVADGGQIRAFH